MTYTDDTPMPWGKHKDTPLKDVPAGDLLWLLQQPWIVDWPLLHTYLKDNQKALLLEAPETKDDDDDDQEGYGSYEQFRQDFHGF